MRTPKKILDRRRSIRIEEALPFTIGHQGYEIEATTINIGTHGAMCLINKDLPLMTQLKVALSIPSFGKKSSAKTIHAKGVVVRKEADSMTKEFFVAIFFSDIKPKDSQILKDFIDHRLSE